ncbi:hypothetical protein, partial [Campylobacter troglodytis]|uniref:hypothetical protein n=1 Tax=Campylobacter troglodytis TaxID=654363 RepID=UPI00163C00B5
FKESKASLYALIEDDTVTCPHGGKVLLRSNKGKHFTSKGVPLILESDYLGSKIKGCANNIAGLSYPCSEVISVKNACSTKKLNNELVILQDLVSNSLTDKGFALKCVSKPNNFIFDHNFVNLKDKAGLKDDLSSLFNARLRLHYKEHNLQRDNLLIKRCELNGKEYYIDTYFKSLEFDIEKDSKKIDDIRLLQDLKQEFKKDFLFKQVNLRLGIHLIKLVFIVCETLPKIYQKAYKSYEDYGIGEFKQIHSYTKDYNEEETIHHLRVFITPYKASKIRFEFAVGMDDWLDDERVCEFRVLTSYIEEEV